MPVISQEWREGCGKQPVATIQNSKALMLRKFHSQKRADGIPAHAEQNEPRNFEATEAVANWQSSTSQLNTHSKKQKLHP